MALYVMMFGGTTPFGAPLLGYISDHLGARSGTAVAGAAALLAAVLLPVVRRSAERSVADAVVAEPSLVG